MTRLVEGLGPGPPGSHLNPALMCLNKNAPTLANCSFGNHGLTLIIFGKLHQHTFKNDMPIQCALSIYFFFDKVVD